MAKHGGTHQRLHGGAGTSAMIPDKLYFRIGEVAALCRVPTYVLRFWQTEFPQLRPTKSGTGQRLYRQRDVEMALRIKRLLHEEGYTIAGAKGVLEGEASLPVRLQPELPLATVAEPPIQRAQAQLRQVRTELRDLLGLLDRKPSAPHLRQPAASLFPPLSPESAKLE